MARPVGHAARPQASRSSRNEIFILNDPLEALLLQRARGGDRKAYSTLFARHYDAAMGAAFRACGDRHIAEDAVSDVFVAALRAFDAGKGPQGSFRAYLLVSAARAAVRMTKKQAKELPCSDTLALEQLPSNPERRMLEQERAAMVQAFSQLPPNWRWILWKLDIEETKPREVAPLLELSPNAVVALHRRAKSALRTAYITAYLQLDPEHVCSTALRFLPGYLAGTLTARRHISCEQHFTECPDCQELLWQARAALEP
ncbi:sigma-70 family RNA polymerase sigma factor [Arthrobacter woluwensis]|uniref:sigma-70 family RNA polymerase sigma factor n=1 Tax=Arthrobacter woluwensis TaxID=156980 RepID=UPI00382E3C7A